LAVIIIKKRTLCMVLTLLLALALLFATYQFSYHPRLVQSVNQPHIIRDVKVTRKAVAFTFDDGPDPQGTLAILKVLKKHQAKATFFMVGTQIRMYPEVARQVAREGHEIGNHGYHHNYRTYCNLEQALHDIKQNEALIYSITGQRPKLLRPPGGFLADGLVESSQKHGFNIVLWSWIQDTKDWKNPPARRQAEHILRNIKPGQILIFHDGGGERTQTVETLDMCLERLAVQGYRFVTVSELLRMERHLE